MTTEPITTPATCPHPGELLTTVRAHAKEARLTGQVLETQLATITSDQLAFLAAYLEAEITSRRASARHRLIAGAHLPTIKTLTGYDWDRLTLPSTLTPTSLAGLDFLTRAEDLICYGDVGCGKTHLATALTHTACQNGIKARFTTAADLVMTLRKAKNEGRLDRELAQLARFRLLTIDELGYLPIDPEGARLLFQVINNTYEKTSLIITTNIEFSRWGTIFGDDNIAAAIIDRLIHHGHLIRHTGTSWRVENALMK